MSGISPKLPLHRDEQDGFYALNKTYEETIKQNFKMLLLTNPGEKIMDSSYGAGIMSYLFENADENSYSSIRSKIDQQVKLYMPFIKIKNISFNDASTITDLSQNQVNISIEYEILPLKKNDSIQIII